MAIGAVEEVHWAALSREEIAAARDGGALVVVPTGATEQHATHLAVSTDTQLASEIAERAARRVDGYRVLVTPALAFGFSPHHLSWPGTISLRLETYLAVLRDTAHAILGAGFGRVLFVNGHGGNAAPLRALCAEMVTDGYAVAMVDYFAPALPVVGPMLKGALAEVGHACEYETALTLALAAKEGAAADGLRAPIDGLPPRALQPWIPPGQTSDPITQGGAGWPPIFQADDCGYYGDPAAASLDSGNALLEETVSHLAAFFAEFSATPLRLGVARDPDRPHVSPALTRKGHS